MMRLIFHGYKECNDKEIDYRAKNRENIENKKWSQFKDVFLFYSLIKWSLVLG